MLKTNATVLKISNFSLSPFQKTLEKKYEILQKKYKEGKLMQEMVKANKEYQKKVLAARTKHVKKEKDFKKMQEGDLVEFTNESGHRTNGVFILKKSGVGMKLEPLANDYDDYGYVGEKYSLSPEKPPGYWDNAGFQYAYWHTEPLPEPVSAKYWKNTKAKDIHSMEDNKQIIDLGWTKLVFQMTKPLLLKLLTKAKKDKVKTLFFTIPEYYNDEIYFYPEWSPYYWWLQQHQEKEQHDEKKQQSQKKITSSKKNRPSPSQSATLFQVGFVKQGNDGNMYQVKQNKKKVKRWVKIKQL